MANINAGPFTTRPEIDGTFGVVASTHWIGTAVGMGDPGARRQCLRRRGRRRPSRCRWWSRICAGPGGDVPAMLYDAKAGKPVVVCGQGPAPAGATIAHYRDHLGLDIVPGTGLLPACVPGTFETYMLILRDHGTMRLRDVLEAAIGYARNGYPLVERACATIATVQMLFREHWPTSAAVYLPGGRVPAPDILFTNVKHAETYKRILKEAEAGGGGREAEIERARRAWSQGFVAETIDQFCRTNEVMDVSGRPPQGRADRAGHGDVAADDRRAGPPRLRQLSRAEAERLDARAGAAADARAAQGLRPRQALTHRPRLRPYLGRVRQARLCRSRGVLRRSQVRRRAHGDAAVGAPTTPSAASSSATKRRWISARAR